MWIELDYFIINEGDVLVYGFSILYIHYYHYVFRAIHPSNVSRMRGECRVNVGGDEYARPLWSIESAGITLLATCSRTKHTHTHTHAQRHDPRLTGSVNEPRVSFI